MTARPATGIVTGKAAEDQVAAMQALIGQTNPRPERRSTAQVDADDIAEARAEEQAHQRREGDGDWQRAEREYERHLDRMWGDA